jgi:hypothetical protein
MNLVPTCTKHVYPADNDDETGHQLADCENVLDTHKQLHTHEVDVGQQPWDMHKLLIAYIGSSEGFWRWNIAPDVRLLGFWAPHIV